MLNGSSSQAWAQVDSGMALSNANPRTGSWHLRKNASSSGGVLARRVFGEPLTEVFIGFAMFCQALPGTEAEAGELIASTYIGSFRDQANGEQLHVMLGTDGAIEVRRTINGAILDRSIPVIGAGAYQHIEMYAKAGNSTAGAFELRVDEVTRLNLTGIDTVATANVEFSQFAFGHRSSSSSPRIDFADFYCNDTVDDGSGCNTFIGDCKSGVLFANADTAQADFALSAGVSGYPLVGQAPPDDSTYISTGSSTAESDFALENGPANLSEILTVRPFVRAMKDDAGTCTIAPNILSNSTKGTVDDQPVTTAFAYYDSNVPVDPDTGVPWIPAGLNAADVVVERTA